MTRIVRLTNEYSNNYHIKFKMLFYYERLVDRKPFGIKIGKITVLTTAVFMRVSTKYYITYLIFSQFNDFLLSIPSSIIS